MYAWAGAERCLDELAVLLPHADILTGIITPQMRAEHPVAARARESWVGRLPGARTKHRWFLPLQGLAFALHDTRGYDLVISVSHALEKMIRPTRKGAKHLCYCLTPPRYLWDLSDSHDELANPVQRLALSLGRAPLRALDQAAARRVDQFVSISAHVAARVRRTYGRNSEVVYPPVAMRGSIVDAPRGGFLLSLGRLVPYKRVDLAIGAAERLGVPLVVAGDGPDRKRLEHLAGPHTTFLGAVSEVDAGRLLSSCAAFVFCAEEDFGIAPVEANAHGAPAVVFGRGGATETIVDAVTGIHFHSQTVDAVAAAVAQCLATSWDAAALRTNAARFAPEQFRDGMRAQLLRAVS